METTVAPQESLETRLNAIRLKSAEKKQRRESEARLALYGLAIRVANGSDITGQEADELEILGEILGIRNIDDRFVELVELASKFSLLKEDYDRLRPSVPKQETDIAALAPKISKLKVELSALESKLTDLREGHYAAHLAKANLRKFLTLNPWLSSEEVQETLGTTTETVQVVTNQAFGSTIYGIVDIGKVVEMPRSEAESMISNDLVRFYSTK